MSFMTCASREDNHSAKGPIEGKETFSFSFLSDPALLKVSLKIRET